MNESVKVQRSPVPKDNVERFIALVWTMADMCHIDKVPEVYHHVELLSRAIEVHLYEQQHSIVKTKVSDERKKFIAIFKNRFSISMDYLYPSSTVSPQEIGMINNMLEKLLGHHVDSDFYLKWVFDVLLQKKSHLNPTSIKAVCSNNYWSEFLYDMKEELKDKKEQAFQQQEAIELINRSRILHRETQDLMIKTKISELLKKFRDGGIILSEFRMQIQMMEKAIKQTKS